MSLWIVPVEQGAIASPIIVNNTCPLAISLVPGVYSVTVFKLEVVKVPSPLLLSQCKLVTLLDWASEVRITEFSQIICAVPEETIGFFWIGIVTVFETGRLHGATGCAVMVSTICPANLSAMLGVTVGLRVLFGLLMVVPVVEVQI